LHIDDAGITIKDARPPLGRGSIGLVYGGRLDSDTRRVVVKFVPIDDTNDVAAVELFREVVMLTYMCTMNGARRNLACPISLSLAFNGETPAEQARLQEPGLYFALALPRGLSAMTFLKRQIEERSVVGQEAYDVVMNAFMKSLVSNVEFVHSLDVVHLDINLNNIIVIETLGGYDTRLIDFDHAYVNFEHDHALADIERALDEVNDEVTSSLREFHTDTDDRDERRALLVGSDVIRRVQTEVTEQRVDKFLVRSVVEQLQWMRSNRDYYVYPPQSVLNGFDVAIDAWDLARFRDIYALGIMYLSVMFDDWLVNMYSQTTVGTLTEFVATHLVDGDGERRLLSASTLASMLGFSRTMPTTLYTVNSEFRALRA
jgi:serine/threonine protein kinase